MDKKYVKLSEPNKVVTAQKLLREDRWLLTHYPSGAVTSLSDVKFKKRYVSESEYDKREGLKSN
jgi:hypothetical protein